MQAIVTVQNVSIVLPHVASVGLIESMGVRFGWQVRFSVSVSAFSFATIEEARVEREKFIQALEEYWAHRGPLYQKLTTAPITGQSQA